MRSEQNRGGYRDWQGHTPFVSIYPVSVGVATNTPVATIGGAVATRESIEKSATRQCPFMAAFNDTRPGAQQG
jgi:hypothetical protein